MKTALLSIAFMLFYCAGLYLRYKKKGYLFPAGSSRYLRYLHYAFLFLFTTLLVLHLGFDLDFRGVWSNRIIITGWLLTGILFYPLCSVKALPTLEKSYFVVLAFLPVGIAAVFLMPLVGSILVLSYWNMLTQPVSRIHYEDSHLRIQSSFSGLLGPSQLNVIEKNGLFEKSHYRTITHDTHFDSLIVNYGTNNAQIIFKSTNQFVAPEEVVVIPYQE